MQLEKKVTSLELAKKIKEFGFLNNSIYFYNHKGELERSVYENGNQHNIPETTISAFTLDELLEMAPASTSILKRTDPSGINPPRYYAETWDIYQKDIWSENPADAVAKLLIYAKENNLL